DGQGNCNLVRVNAANQLAAWLAMDPTGTGEPDVLVLGDLNSYAKEDPVTALAAAGYADMLASFVGPSAYSYVFDGQWGYLDHVLGSSSAAAQVAGIAVHHVNADEPSVLDYNVDFKTANLQATLYAPDQYRMADHDPVVVGLTPATPPAITSFAPTQGATGTVVTITGTGFVDVTSVTVGGVPVPFTVVSPTTIVATIGASVKSGRIVVRTLSGVATSAGSFTVALAPTVLGFSPGAGKVGSTVTITGANLAYTKSVTIGGKAAAFKVASPTIVTATVPAGAVTGKIVVTGPYGSATSTKLFYVLP
ncbi:MAG: IPT/TIG domain-containing protein, partial [Chloroflexi bacterium]|nr:IPT/TIG domain-containing protein [Chloroflexota bacterium]